MTIVHALRGCKIIIERMHDHSNKNRNVQISQPQKLIQYALECYIEECRFSHMMQNSKHFILARF